MLRARRTSTVVLLAVAFLATNAPGRTWTDASGKFRIEADLAGVANGQVSLAMPDGRKLTVPLEKLSDADRQYVAQWQAAQPAPGAKDAGSEKKPLAPLEELSQFVDPKSPPKATLPTAEQLSRARAKVRDIFQMDFAAAGDREAREKLVAKLQQLAAESVSDSQAQASLLLEALDLTIADGDVAVAQQIGEALAATYKLDGRLVKSRVLIAMAGRGKSPDQQFALAAAAIELAQQSLKAEDDETVARLVDLAGKSAAGLRSLDRRRELQARLGRLDQLSQQRKQVQAAQDKLRTSPDDPQANLIVGRHLLFDAGSDEGLAYLAKGSDRKLRAVAEAALVAKAAPEEQFKLADAWWSFAQGSNDEDEKALALGRARDLYAAGIEKATGLARIEAQKRLDQINRAAKEDVGLYDYRTDPKLRARILKSTGGTDESERAVALALQWLAEHQLADGGWSFDHRQGRCQGRCSSPGEFAEARNAATALALLPFLGAGHTHENSKQYKNVVRGGLGFLASQMQANGSLMDAQGNSSMYSHGLATICLCEAYGMTKDRKLRPVAQKAVGFTALAQDPAGGGWRYQPQQPGDTSVSGWQITSLYLAHDAKLAVPENCVVGAGKFLDSVSTNDGADYGYVTPGAGETTTVIGLLCRAYMGWKKDNPALRQGAEALAKRTPPDNMYFNYYATLLLRHYGGPEWKAWSEKTRDKLVKGQSREEHQEGSWFYTDRDRGAERGGRLYCTALAALVLESYYRYPSLYDGK